MTHSANELDQMLAQQTLSETLFAIWAQKEAGLSEDALEAAKAESSDSSLLAHLVAKGAIPLSTAMETSEDPSEVRCTGCDTAYEVGAILLPLVSDVPCPRCSKPLVSEAEEHETSSARTKAPQGPRRVGDYSLLRSLGRGGMAEVFLASDADGKRVAIKLLSHGGPDPASERRFDREGRVLGQLDHENIVATLGSGVDELTGRPYLILELVEGENLFALLRRRDRGQLTVAEATYVLSRCASALAHAHEKGIYHRDLKPANVIVTPTGAVKLADFGIATTSSTLRITSTNEVVGTLGFVCPEALGPGQLDWSSSSDIYALGALAYRLIAGRNAFVGSSLKQVLEAQQTDGFLPLNEAEPAVPEVLSQLVGRLLSADPAKRPNVEEARRVFAELAPDAKALTELRKEVSAALLRRGLGRAKHQASEDLQAGDEFEHYRIEEEVGRGGMGIVYRAHHLTLNRSVALKVLLAGTLASEEDRARFLREAESAGRLQHPNIVPILDAGVGANGVYYFTMEFVQGDRLSQWLKDRGTSTSLRVFTRICSAVQHAHSRGVIHRDLKPSNMIVDRMGEPRVLDFGIAKRVEEGSTSHKKSTSDGSILGTLAYMPPEQAGGHPGDVDVRSDVYALGTILYEFLSGSTPFEGNPREMLKQIHFVDPEPPSARASHVPWELDAICLKALEKERDERYQSALELKRDIERFLEGVPIRAQRANAFYRLRKWVLRNRGQAAIAAASFVVIATLIAGIIYYAVATERQRQQAVVDEVVSGWQQVADGKLSEAARSMTRARSQLEPDDLLILPDGAEAYLPRDVHAQLSEEERSRPRLHSDRLDRWVTYVEARRDFEGVRVLLLEADQRLARGDLDGADERIRKALLLQPDTQVVVETGERVSARFAAHGMELLGAAAEIDPKELVERGRLLELARARMHRAQELDKTSADALAGLIEVHRELSKHAELTKEAAARAEAQRRADELLASARDERDRGKRMLIDQELPEVIRRHYLKAIQYLQQALFLVQGHPEATGELRKVAAEFSAILVDQGQPELAEFMRQLGGVSKAVTGRVKVPLDPHLAIVESGAAMMRNKFGRDVYFKPTRVFNGQREVIKTRGGDRYRIVMQVRTRIVGGASHQRVLATGLMLRMEDRTMNTIGPPTHIKFKGGPWVRRVAVDNRGRRIIGPFTECPGFDVHWIVRRVDTVVKDMLRSAGR